MSDPDSAASDPLRAVASGESISSPGREIRLARERAGFSLEELAAQTRLTRATLAALEMDDFLTLTEPVYVRGYYRKCAKVLHLFEPQLIAAYERMVAPRAPAYAPPKLLLSSSEDHPRGFLLRWWIPLLALLVLIAVILYVFAGRSTSGSEAASQTPASGATDSSDPGAADSAPVQTAAQARTEDEAASPPTADVGAGSAPAPGANPPKPKSHLSAPADLASPTSDSAAGVVVAGGPVPPDGLVLQFKQTSWVRVEDGAGHLLLSGLIPAGARQVLIGRLPYSVFLGNAPGVTAEFDGKALDVTASTHQNSTARFNVPQAAPGAPD